ncbi:hypothetical protein OG598_18005 [Micromonospora sp. NBC_00330]|nr:hypothetical protein [Micromonospora sp. NBC_00330]
MTDVLKVHDLRRVCGVLLDGHQTTAQHNQAATAILTVSPGSLG